MANVTTNFIDDLSRSDKTWPIAEVERETGLGKDTLRVWERRYGFPVPMRDRQGERLYPEEQLQRLSLLRRLLDMGYRPGKVVPLPLAELRSRLDEGVKTTRASAFRVDKTFSPDEADRWTQWLAQDRSDLIRQALQQQILRQGLGMVVDELIAPLCVLVGQAWMNGDISIYQEHLFTETLQSVLREAISLVDASGQTLQRSPRVLLTTPPNEQHVLGLLMAECHFALEACERFVLGTSTPIADIILAVQQLNIHVLALSFSAHASRRDVLESLQMLVEQIPSGVDIWVGGAGAMHHQRLLPSQVVLMQKPGDVVNQVLSWRQKNGARENPADNFSHLA